MFDGEKKGRRWLQFDDRSFEPRDPYEDLRVRRVGAGPDFWEIEKPSDWLPDARRYRKPEKTALEPRALRGGEAAKPRYHLDDPLKGLGPAGQQSITWGEFTECKGQCYWTVHPRPGACERCQVMAGINYQVEPERPHPNCKCLIKRHEVSVGIGGILGDFGATATETFDAGQTITVEVKNIGAFNAAAWIRVDGMVDEFTGFIRPTSSSVHTFSKLAELPVPWTVFLRYQGGDKGTLRYAIMG